MAAVAAVRTSFKMLLLMQLSKAIFVTVRIYWQIIGKIAEKFGKSIDVGRSFHPFRGSRIGEIGEYL